MRLRYWQSMGLLTLRDAVVAAAGRLDGADARRDAEMLLLHTLKLGRTALFIESGRTLSEDEKASYEAAIARRAGGEPIQYILGQQEFYGLMLKVSPAVLIPRPETELLVEAVLERLPKDERVRVVDVGTGSGAIAIVLARSLQMAAVTAVDLSEAALMVARENAAMHGMMERIEFVRSDLLESVAGKRFGAVVSNPPYVPETDRESLHRQVRDYEPEMALFGGAEGMDIYRRLVPQAWAALNPGGLLAMEFGYGQRDTLTGLLDGWDDVEFLDDLQGIPRVVLARRSRSRANQVTG